MNGKKNKKSRLECFKNREQNENPDRYFGPIHNGGDNRLKGMYFKNHRRGQGYCTCIKLDARMMQKN